MFLNDLETKDIVVLIIACVIFLILFVFFIIRLLRKKKKRFLYYHYYNNFLVRNEKKLNLPLQNKKIVFHIPNRVNYSDLLKNIESLEIINENCIDLINAQSKNTKKRQKDIVFDLKALQRLPVLVDTRGYEDIHNEKLLKDIFMSIMVKKSPIIDHIILKCFGNKNYFVFKNKLFYIYNDQLLTVTINKNRLITPMLINYDKLNVEMNYEVKYRFFHKYRFEVFYNDELLFSKIIHCHKKRSNYYKNISTLIDSLELFHDCPNVADALKKHQHIEKMNENTMIKIESMSGRKFVSWTQLALKSIYKTDVELKSDDAYGLYLLMKPSRKNKLIIIGVKRHQEKISSSVIKNLKLIQEKEKADEAWLITNNEFTRVSVSLASSTNVKLIGKSELECIVNKYNTNFYQNF